MKRAMPRRVYDGWRLYWNEEPWGPWRDNLHTAVVARELARNVPGRRRAPDLQAFFYRNPFAQADQSNATAVLGTLARRVTAEEASVLLKAAKARRKKARRKE